MIAIVTDSTSDLPADTATSRGIVVVPAVLNIGHQSFRDGIDLSRDAFYDQLPALAQPPTTASPAPGDFLAAYDAALTRADQVVSIHAASRLSGIFNAARIAAQQIAPDRIHVVDSEQLSMGLGWGVLAGADAAASGGSLEAVLHSIADTLSRVRLYALLNSLEYMARSGRVNMVRMGLSTLLRIKPLVELRHGTVTSLARVRTWTRAVSDLAERSKRLAPVDRLAVMHTRYVEGAEMFLSTVNPHLDCPSPPVIVQATTVIGTHVGPHALGIAVVVRKQV
jgi:DegV family protein with EDD domain